MMSEFPAAAAAAAATAFSQNNPLLATSAPLLNAVVQIRQAATHDDPAGLRQQLIDEIRLFETRCKQSGLAFEMMIGARYCLCATLDEAAAQTPWGNCGVWSGNGLLITFHHESWGDEKVFQLLSRISQNPTRYLWLLEIIHFCLLLGFEGHYRGIEQGHQQCATVRCRLAELIAKERSAVAACPSAPRVTRAMPGLSWRTPVPMWVCFCLTALVAGLLFSALNWRLGNATEPLLRQIWQIPLPQEEAGPPDSSSQMLSELRQSLSDLIARRQLQIAAIANGSRVTLSANQLFAPSGMELTPEGRALIARIAFALADARGTLLIDVHGNNQHPQSIWFPSNYAYSLAQARNISSLMQRFITQPALKIRIQGHSDRMTLPPGDGVQNRTRMRRVEFTLLAAPTGAGESDTREKR